MLKQFRSIHLLAIITILALTACQSDDVGEQGRAQHPAKDDKVNVTLRITPAGTRATDWQDANVNAGEYDEEMMNIWTVVMVNDEDNKVERIFVGKPTYTPTGHANDNREIDLVVEDLELTAGDKYHFYSFANISPNQVFTLLGLTVEGYEEEPSDNGVNIYEAASITPTGGTGNATIVPKPANGGEGTYVDDITVSLGANGKVYADLSGDNPFGFSSKGIPMSNVQTYTIPETGATKDLIVIRMVAKLEFPIFNETGKDLAIKSITISDLTQNPANSAATLKLLPTLTNHDGMDATHKDLYQDIATMPTVTAAAYTYAVPEAKRPIAKNTAYSSGTPAQTIAFYVNESKRPTNGDGLFLLTVELSDDDYRFALISQTGKTPADNGAWDYIARNDYRVIPIVLDDYRLEMIPYDFPAIGVYPASVKTIDVDKHLYEIEFHDYGHFHLVPTMKKVSDNSIVSFSATAPSGTYGSTSWGLVSDNFASSWGSWTDETKTTAYNNASATPAFYRTGDASYITTTTDGDEVGGAPVWYSNSASPQWDPAGGTTYNPFIFGYIADPGEALTADRKVYHEFSAYLYKQGMTAARQITYKFYMTLDQTQMIYTRGILGDGRRTHSCQHGR